MPVKALKLEEGSKFGHWTILAPADIHHKAQYYTCRCSCGIIKDVNKYSLIRGESLSCGCLNQKHTIKIGDVFNRLTVLSDSERLNGRTACLCKCVCGNEIVVQKHRLVSGNTSSCGCYYLDSRTLHGKSATSEYCTWSSMKQRCTNYNSGFPDSYINKGIKVCAGWGAEDGFINFFEDMGEKPSKQHSIDRIDNDMHYSCGHCEECLENGWTANCRWATQREQNLNKGTTLPKLTIGGETKYPIEWAEIYSQSYRTVAGRLKTGSDGEEALGISGKRIKKMGNFFYNGEKGTLRFFAEKYGINYHTLENRVHKNKWSIDVAIETKVNTYTKENKNV